MEEKQRIINVRIDNELYTKIKFHLEKTNQNLSQIIRTYLEKLIDENYNIDKIIEDEKVELILKQLSKKIKEGVKK
jgi:antitoxin component of RelBE/YafQ-DinJ toxin-antitoxin module